MMRKVKIAQIGIGHDHSTGIFETLKKQTDIFDIVGYATVENEEQEYGEKLGIFEGYNRLSVDEILNSHEIEGVFIETEEKNLSKYSLMAAENNKHIHMDKPGGMELCDFERLIGLVKEKDLIFNLGYMYRYNPEVKRVLSEVKNNELGEILCVEGQMSGIYPFTPEKRQWLERFKGGMMFFLGCHIIDIVLSCMGKPENIIPFNKCTGLENVTSEDFSMAIFEYKNGTSFVKNNARENGASKRRQIVICGSEKTVEIKPLEYVKDGMMYTDTTYNTILATKKCTSAPYQRYDEMTKSFARMICKEEENPRQYDYELMLYKCILKACGYDIKMDEI